jgi:hypothetical protein
MHRSAAEAPDTEFDAALVNPPLVNGEGRSGVVG